jgi:polysaccharide biosynthesis/export protein
MPGLGRRGTWVLLMTLCAAGGPSILSAQSAADSTGGAPAAGILLRPGDVIRLQVWQEPTWSGDFDVNEEGIAVLPRLGPVQVTRMSPDSLRRFLIDSLGRFLRNPSIQVTPLRRIQVLGAVRSPGLYPVAATVTVPDVLALAGGATPDGKTNEVILRRDGQDLTIMLGSQTSVAEIPIQTGDELFVPEKGWVSRNPGLFAAALSATTTILVALILR